MQQYIPIEGGWKIKIKGSFQPVNNSEKIGICVDDPRQHRRPLYPEADKGIFYEQLTPETVERYPFRPLVIAYNAPRFIFDYHMAGGLLGHLLVGIVMGNGKNIWLHECEDIEVSYVYGRMEYKLHDARIPGVCVELSAVPTAEVAGLALRWKVTGVTGKASLVLCYGGASGTLLRFSTPGDEMYTFSPEQCVYDEISCRKEGFTLRRRFDQPEGPSTFKNIQPPLVSLHKEWEAHLHAGCSSKPETGLASPSEVLISPQSLLDSTEWCSAGSEISRMNRVAVQQIPLNRENTQEGYFVIGMGKVMAESALNPAVAYKKALARNEKISSLVTVTTPDPYLNASLCMLVFSTEGTWGETAFLHGALSWRNMYLGWRCWYGPDICGWTERVKISIRNHIKMSLLSEGDDKGGFVSLVDITGNIVYYNMNEVFLDHVRHYFDYTADLEFMREIFPVLKGVIEWESRRLQPGNEGLYENALNTWVSDSHWYIRGQCTQASAYMLRAHEFMTDLSERLGEDPTFWREHSVRIRAAMQKKLWQARQGVFAESLDTIGSRLLHPEPELATIYHSAEFGAADPLQIYQMLHWVDTHLKYEVTPGGGKQYWSANWYPNNARSYTHSTYDMVFAENLNYALTNYLSGRNNEAYALLRSTLCGIFNGPTPGGISCNAYVDGRQRFCEEFSDTSSMWIRTVMEGTFGIAPKRQDKLVELSPQFPADWPSASVKSPHFSYKWERAGGCEVIKWESPVRTAVRLRLPLHANRINRVFIDGKTATYKLEAGVGLIWLLLEVPEASSGEIKAEYEEQKLVYPMVQKVKNGEIFKIDLSAYGASSFIDPQGILKDGLLENEMLKGTFACSTGPAVLFVLSGGNCPVLIPLCFDVTDSQAVLPKIWSSPKVKNRELEQWELIDISGYFNSPLVDVPEKVANSATPPPLPAGTVGFDYWLSHLRDRLSRRNGVETKISDAAWRAKIGSDGIAWTTENIPFMTSKTGNNIAVVTRAGGFTEKIYFKVPRAKGRTLYLMISGVTWPAQSHVVNLRVTLDYEGGISENKDLVNPFDIGDCWDNWLGCYHDTAANGFENLGGRFGPDGSGVVKSLTEPIEVDTEAHLLAFPLQSGKTLSGITLEAVANDIIFGLMGATILK
jgi:hypothetical protein